MCIKIEVDLTYGGRMAPEASVIFNLLAMQLRGSFTQLVSEMGQNLSNNLDWWVSGPASRNTRMSPLFHYYCSFHLITELLKKEIEIDKIIVDSSIFKKIIFHFLRRQGKKIKIIIKGKGLPQRIKLVLVPFIMIPLEVYILICKLYYARKTKQLQKPLPNSPLILIDTFAYPGYIDQDRYYTGLWENLDSKQKQTIFFVPFLVMIPVKKMSSAFRELRTAERNFLLMEDYLKISDIINAVLHYFRLFRMKLRPAYVLGEDFSLLAREEHLSMRGYPTAVSSILIYLFTRRIKQADLKLKLTIDWFENQVFDKGWTIGFNKNYPGLKSFGYLGYVPSKMYISSSSPSEFERICNVLPSRIAVIGKGLFDQVREFSSELKLETAPAFRFQHLWKKNAFKSDPKTFTILVALTIFPEESRWILELLSQTAQNLKLPEAKFYVKYHPAMPRETLNVVTGTLMTKLFEVVEEPADKLIPQSDLLVTGDSSICLESMALGIPVLVIENPNQLNFSAIPNGIPQTLWRNCKTMEDVLNALNYYYGRTKEEVFEHKRLGL